MDRDNDYNQNFPENYYYYEHDYFVNTLTPDQVRIGNNLWTKLEEIRGEIRTMVNYYPPQFCQHCLVYVVQYERILRNIRCTVEFQQKIGILGFAILTLKVSIDQIILNGLFNRICYRWIAERGE